VPWLIPAGTYRVTSVIAYTGGDCSGTLLSANDSTLTSPAFEIATVATDIASVTSAEVNAYTNMVRGANKLGNLTNRHGQFLYIDSDDVLLGRLGGSNLRQGDCFVVDTDDGYISPPLYSTWTLPATNVLAYAKTLRPGITITGLAVQLDGTASGERNCAIQVSRCNTKLVGCRVTNSSTGTVQQGFKVQSAANITFDTCTVDNLGVAGTNYSWQAGFGANVLLLNCSQSKCRRGCDAQRAKNVRIVGGSFPSGIGAHYAWGFSASGAVLAGDNSQNGHAVLVSGGDFAIRDCDITISGIATAAVRVRSDLFECGGKLIISGNRIVFDDTDGALANTAYVADLRGQNASAYDALRTVEMPRLLSITDNAVSLLGAGSSTIVEVISFLMDYTSFTQTITCSGTWEVSGNDFQYANGTSTGGLARSHFVVFKPTSAAGAGYQIHLADLPGVYCYSYCASGLVNSTARNDWQVDRTGTTNLMSLAYGTFRRAVVSSETVTFNFPTGTGAYVAIGDEIRAQTAASANTVANGTVATVLGSLGPTGAQTTVQGWQKILVGGTSRYTPYW
jgi:hypothetical protein